MLLGSPTSVSPLPTHTHHLQRQESATCCSGRRCQCHPCRRTHTTCNVMSGSPLPATCCSGADVRTTGITRSLEHVIWSPTSGSPLPRVHHLQRQESATCNSCRRCQGHRCPRVKSGTCYSFRRCQGHLRRRAHHLQRQESATCYSFCRCQGHPCRRARHQVGSPQHVTLVADVRVMLAGALATLVAGVRVVVADAHTTCPRFALARVHGTRVAPTWAPPAVSRVCLCMRESSLPSCTQPAKTGFSLFERSSRSTGTDVS